jgi:cell division transport system permease protein
MRALSAAVYFLRQGLSNLARHPLHASVGVLTLAVSLILVGFLGLFMWKANVLVDRLAGGLQLTVYLDPEITPGGADELMKVLREQWAEVDSVTFHSEVEDKTRNAELLPRELVEELDPDLIPAQPYLEVTLDIEHLDEVRAEQLVQWFGALDRVQGVDDVLFGSEKISVAFSLLRGAQNVGLFISIVIVLAALFFVITTTRLIVEGRRREIEILLLVGATRNFIRIPHYIEGGLQGTLAGLMAFSVVWFMQRQLLSSLRSTSQLLVPIDLLPTGMVAWFLLGGIFLGLLGSALGMARYLKLSK